MSEEQKLLDALQVAIIEKINKLADRVERGERLERQELDMVKLQLIRISVGRPE